LLMKYLRTIPEYHQSLMQTSQNTSLFLYFINMLINDSIYLLDEVITKIKRINEIERLMNNAQSWLQLSQQNRLELEQEQVEDESYVTTFCRLANETLLLLHYLSSHDVETFLRPEMIDRLAVMLNYFLDHLVGPKSKQLKVKENEKYHFHPRLLLSKLVEIYINFFNQDKAFVEAVIRDGRSFSIDTFSEATKTMTKYSQGEKKLVTAEVSKNWNIFVENLEACANRRAEDELSLGEIPTEFLDPLLSEIMVDPVILPSGNVVDRPVIERHLLSNPTDPFNRQPLTVDMLVSDVKLKERIEEWKKKMRSIPRSSEKKREDKT